MTFAAHTDARGLAITAGSDAAVAAFDDFERRLLRLDQGAEAIIDAAAHYPDTPMVQLGAAAFCLFGQTYLASLIGCGRCNDARSYFERMTRTRPLTPLDRQWLAQINAA